MSGHSEPSGVATEPYEPLPSPRETKTDMVASFSHRLVKHLVANGFPIIRTDASLNSCGLSTHICEVSRKALRAPLGETQPTNAVKRHHDDGLTL